MVEPMIEYDGWMVPENFASDGCTCAPDRWFGVNLRPACVMHDFHRRHLCYYDVMDPQEADKIFKHHLRALGCPRFLSHWYWLAVKLSRKRYSETQPFPPGADWWRYLFRVT